MPRPGGAWDPVPGPPVQPCGLWKLLRMLGRQEKPPPPTPGLPGRGRRWRRLRQAGRALPRPLLSHLLPLSVLSWFLAHTPGCRLPAPRSALPVCRLPSPQHPGVLRQARALGPESPEVILRPCKPPPSLKALPYFKVSPVHSGCRSLLKNAQIRHLQQRVVSPWKPVT